MIYTRMRTVGSFALRLFRSQPDMWKKCLDCIDELLDILFGNNNIFIGENIAEDSEFLAVSDQVSISFSSLHIKKKMAWV